MPNDRELPARALAALGALGALAPDIVWLYSKRLAEDGLAIPFAQYITVTVAYLALAAIVAIIFPYPGRLTRWKPFAVGVSLPTVISGAANVLEGYSLSLRGGPTNEGILGLIAFF